MKFTLIAIAIAGMTTEAHAQSGTTLSMTCTQVRGIVTSQGAAVLRTGPMTYDRYVRDVSFCARQETAWPTWVRTADVPQCPMRICQSPESFSGR